jgi:hypothetical protein
MPVVDLCERRSSRGCARYLGPCGTLRFPSPLIEPDVQISRIRLVRYRRTGTFTAKDVPNTEGHDLDRAHFALDIKVGEISVPLGSS